VRWNFGDGTTANGEAVKHVYRHRGRYTVLVAATDAAGRAETASAIVTVSKRRR
jgi:chitodextrinase